MATLSEQIAALATQIGTDVKQLVAHVGNMSDLTTTQTSSLVGALNELKATISELEENLGAQINDTQTSNQTTWSSEKIIAQISSAISDLVAGAPTTLDTLKEIADQITQNKDLIESLESIAAGHVKVDAAQNLTDQQKAQGRTNLGAASATELTTLQGSVNALSGTVAQNTTAIGQNTDAIGTLNSLETATKTNLVGAINEIKGTADNAGAAASAAQSTANSAQSIANGAQTAVTQLTNNVGDTQKNFVAVYTAARDGTAS